MEPRTARHRIARQPALARCTQTPRPPRAPTGFQPNRRPHRTPGCHSRHSRHSRHRRHSRHSRHSHLPAPQGHHPLTGIATLVECDSRSVLHRNGPRGHGCWRRGSEPTTKPCSSRGGRLIISIPCSATPPRTAWTGGSRSRHCCRPPLDCVEACWCRAWCTGIRPCWPTWPVAGATAPRKLDDRSWWNYCGAGAGSNNYRLFFGRGLTRCFVATRAEEMSARTGAGILLQLLFDIAKPDRCENPPKVRPADRALNAPTSAAWIKP